MAKLDSITSTHDTEQQEKQADSRELQQRASAVRSRARSFLQTVMRTKTSSAQEIRELESYFAGMRLEEDGYDGIRDREVFFEGENGTEGWGRKMERDAINLHREFTSKIEAARAGGYISSESMKRWEDRFADSGIGFKQREYWVQRDMPRYIEGWKKVSDERKAFLREPGLKEAVQYDPRFTKILDNDKFLNMHYNERKNLLAEARSTLLAGNKMQLDLHAKAKSKLESAVSAGFLSATKVGTWLERTFKSNASPKKIEAFVNGTGTNSLTDLMLSWRAVKGRYDTVAKKFNERGSESGVRGFKLVSPTQFLNMHYTQRLRYVEQAEDRMDDAKNIDNEAPVLLKIRHAMDMKDWEDAAGFITEAKMSQLSEKDWKRLKSMESYVTQFGKKAAEGPGANVMDAKKRLDGLVESIGSSHSELQPMILRLLKGPNANRSIHQLRWVVYNNLWCRTHGPPYLSDDIARKGSSKDQEQLTKYRAEQGLDVGRNDVLSYETADRAYFRKEEKARHKATYLQTNVKSGGVMSMVAEKMEREQDSKWLYWTTFCPHSDGDPKSEGWMRELMMHLTEMRSLTATIKKAGFAYGGPNSRLVSLN